MVFDVPLIFTLKKNDSKYYDELYIPDKDSDKYKESSSYLKRIKEILNLPYEIKTLISIIREKNNNYVITNDNFKKMVLLLYRIIANVPVIIMGDTGCGKTSLIKVLNQIINGGEFKCERIEIENDVEIKKEVKALKIININPAIDEEKICKEMDEADKDAEE